MILLWYKLVKLINSYLLVLSLRFSRYLRQSSSSSKFIEQVGLAYSLIYYTLMYVNRYFNFDCYYSHFLFVVVSCDYFQESVAVSNLLKFSTESFIQSTTIWCSHYAVHDFNETYTLVKAEGDLLQLKTVHLSARILSVFLAGYKRLDFKLQTMTNT